MKRLRAFTRAFLLGLAGVALLLTSCAPVPAAPVAPAAPPAPAQAAASAPAPGVARPTPTLPPLPATSVPPNSQPALSPTRAVPSEQPKSGGRLNLMSSANPPSLDAQQEVSINTYVVTGPVYNHLVRFDLDTGTRITPELAETWTVSPDGKIYTFKIRRGVKFHNGDAFTSDDVLFNLQRLIDPPKGINSLNAALLKPALDRIEKVDSETVALRLKYPLAPTFVLLAKDNSPIYPTKVVEAKGHMKNDAVGTGPFTLESYTPGVGAELVKFNDYYVRGHPYLNRVSVRIVPDPATRVAALRTGQVHMTARGFSTLSPREMELVKASVPDIQFYPAQTPLGPAFTMNVRRPPFSDVRVRKAISLTLDRQAAVKIVADGQGQVGTILFLKGWGVPLEEVLTWPGWRQSKDQDIAAAQKLMAEAGYPNGFDLEVMSRTNQITLTSATFVAGQLRTLGIRAQVKPLEDALFYDPQYQRGFQGYVDTPSYSTPDPGWIVSTRLVPGGSLNPIGPTDDKRMVELNTAQMGATDEDLRKKLIREAETYALQEQITMLPIVWPYTFIAVAPQVRGFVLGLSDYTQNGNVYEQLWLAQ